MKIRQSDSERGEGEREREGGREGGREGRIKREKRRVRNEHSEIETERGT